MKTHLQEQSELWKVFNWIIGLSFIVIGILNLILIHPVPGLIYIVIAMIYFPPIADRFENIIRIRIPQAIKIILAFLIIWFTLAVGELVELFESII
ncbi:MAG: hypothetical protein HKO96_08490 [Flavobacteriaceae bacterium]|nr:hypothetical protein [Flavobacteriaceae bacterium]